MDLRLTYLKTTLFTLTLVVVLAAPTAPLAVASEEESEPKQLQRLYKCLDRKIVRLSKKKRRRTAEHVLTKCDNRLQKWLALLPEESHSAFLSQLTASVELAMEDAAHGRFVADEE